MVQIKKTGLVDLGVPTTAGILVNAPSSDFNSGRLFVDVLRSTSCVEAKAVGLKVLSSSFLNHFLRVCRLCRSRCVFLIWVSRR